MRNYEIAAIAGLPDRAFQAIVESGTLSKSDIAAARAMRAGRTAKRDVEAVTIRKREEEPKMETLVEKVERSHRMGAILRDTIDAYAAKHGVSKSVATERILMSPEVSEYHRLDRDLRNAERATIALSKLEGSANLPPVSRSKPARTPTPVKPSEAGRVSPRDAPAATNDEETAAEALQRLADLQQTKNPAMARARAISVAANSKEFAEAFRTEKSRKGF
jgi:hypothetical protein